jgi:hypothetical protein
LVAKRSTLACWWAANLAFAATLTRPSSRVSLPAVIESVEGANLVGGQRDDNADGIDGTAYAACTLALERSGQAACAVVLSSALTRRGGFTQ